MKQLERHLSMIPGLHRESLHHVAAIPRRSNPTKISGSRGRDPLDIAVLDVRRDIRLVLQSWAELVAEKRRTAPPGRGVAELTRFLTAHLAWLTAQPPAADFADEVAGAAAGLHRAIDHESTAAPAPARNCVVDGCPGTIAAAVPGGGPGGALSCSAGHSWEVGEWLALRPLVQRRRERAGA
ncbi:hypothetical protein ACGFZL_30130 [Streptomyces sp. NPDC048182]|uniref:hypothetical protein n=1 Tax=unclassified Streptomyces TaxID=2593676 RepID=UPI0033BDB392